MYDDDRPWQNELLAELPVAVQQQFFPQLERVNLAFGTCLCEPGRAISHVYFPGDSIMSVFYSTTDGYETEVAVIGKDGMTGIALFMGGESTNSRTVVVNSGSAWRMPAAVFKCELDKHEELEQLLLHYSQYLITHMSQTAVCNRFHSIYQQLCRWLLLSLDRSINNKLIMTQKLIANNLGVRREGVTGASCELQQQGIIEYHRGIIIILDRFRLEKACCECYAVVRDEKNRLLSHTHKHAAPAKRGLSNINTRYKYHGSV